MTLDSVLKDIGEFGLYQKRIYSLLIIPAISIGTMIATFILVLYTPPHRCKLPGLENDTYAVQDPDHQLYISRFIPPGKGTKKYDACHLYDLDTALFDANNRPVNGSRVSCDDWVFDKTVFSLTFTEKTKLVCGDKLKVSHAQMFFFFGILVCDFVLGVIADTLGRKKALFIGLMSMCVTSIVSTWAPELYSFAVLQFFVGGSAHACFIVASVIGLEMVGPAKRVYTGLLLHVFFAVGLSITILLTYLIRDWQYINLACAVPTVLFVSYWWLVPESARWLANQGRREECERIIRHAAKVNKAPITEEMLKDASQKPKVGSQGKLWHILKSPVLMRRTLILCFNWFVVAMTYYGVTLNAGNMTGTFLLNFFLMVAASAPGYVLAIGLVDRLGRRWVTSAMMIVGGASCVCTIFSVMYGGKELQPLTITLAFIGKAGASGAFALIYLFTSEILPTVVRNAGMGFCSCAARVGAMLCPYIANSGHLVEGKISKALPLVIFGTLSFMAGLLLLLLPETMNERLPDTIQEGEQFGSKRRKNKDDIGDGLNDVAMPFIEKKG